MGQEASEARRAAFAPYQVNEALMAARRAWFMHCLPAHRGEEVTAEVIDGPRSAVWRQATNRMHTARGAMLWLLNIPIEEEADGRQTEGGARLFGRARHLDHPQMAADRI